MSKTTNRFHMAPGEGPQPVGEIIFEADGRRRARGSAMRSNGSRIRNDSPSHALCRLENLFSMCLGH